MRQFDALPDFRPDRRNVVLLLGAIAGIPLLTACMRKEASAMNMIETPDLKLAAELDTLGDQVHLSWSVTSRAKVPLYLLDGVHGEIGNDGILPMRTLPWIGIGPNGVELALQLIDPPADRLVESLNLPLPTRLLPGQEITGRAVLEMPVLPEGPYQKFRTPDHPDARVLPVFFQIGYFADRPGVQAMARPVRTSAGPRQAFPALSTAGQTLVRIGPIGSIRTIVNAQPA